MAAPAVGSRRMIFRSSHASGYGSLTKVILFVSGLTVNRKRPETEAVVLDKMEPPPVRVPPLAFGEFSGKSCVVATL